MLDLKARELGEKASAFPMTFIELDREDAHEAKEFSEENRALSPPEAKFPLVESGKDKVRSWTRLSELSKLDCEERHESKESPEGNRIQSPTEAKFLLQGENIEHSEKSAIG